ncbi:MAG: uracil phosphoribosyltransferase [Pseudomonadota bacterium]
MDTKKYYKNVTLLEHPLAQHKLTLLRDKTTEFSEFRQITRELSLILAVKATEQLITIDKQVNTPLEQPATGKILKYQHPIIIPILRAGLSMLDAFLTILPKAKIGFIGLKRDETTYIAKRYYYNVPNEDLNLPIFILDPMLATSGSASSAIEQLKQTGFTNIRFVSMLAAPEGIIQLSTLHPDIKIITCAIDKQLDENAFITPGLGDAGDRFCGNLF